MKKLIKLEFNNTTRERKTEDSYSELYSHDKNNGSFEFEILNDTLTTEQVIALFKFTESNKIWKTTGTVEGNKVKVTFDTTLITQNETVICYLYFDEEQRTSDTFRFKFKVKVSEIDKMNRYEVKERFINNTVIVDRLDVVTKTELQEALKNVGGIATEGLLTEVKAEELYAKKSEAVDNTNFELIKNRVLALELKTDKDTVYDDSELKGRISVLEAREDNNTIYDDTNVRERLTALESKPNVDVNNIVTKDELASKNYLTEHQDTSNFALKSEIPQQYNDTEVKERLTTLENKPPVDLSNYATKEELRNVSGSQPLADNLVTKEELENKHYISDVSNLATKDELQEVRNSQPTVDTSHLVTRDELESKGYLTTHQDLSEYAKKSELYNDSDLKARVEVLEQKTDKDTVYDDTPLKERVTALESKAIAGGTYDDSDLRNRVVALETKEDKDTKYDDTEVKNRLTELENKPAVDTSVFVTEDKLNSKGYLTQHQDLSPYALKSEIPTPYNDSPLTERITALENRPTTGGSVNTSNLVTKDELKNQHYVTHEEVPIAIYKEFATDNFNEYFEQTTSEFLNSNTHMRGKIFVNPDNDYSTTSPLVYTGDSEHPKTAEYDAILYSVANSLPDGYSLESLNEDNKVTFLSNKNFSEVVPKEELKAIVKEFGGSTGSNIDTSNLATKEELANAVTKNELEAKHYVTEEELNNKAYLTQQNLDNYALKSELPTPYNDSLLNERVTALESKAIEGGAYNDTDLRNRVINLENKPPLDTSEFVTNQALESRGYIKDVSNLVTKDELEGKHYISDISNLVTKEELENKGYLKTHQNLDNVVTKEELATKGYITDVSNLVTKQELESKNYLTTPYNDTPLKERVEVLENKVDKDTIYNDTELRNRVEVLENKPNVDLSNYVTSEQLENKHYLTQHQPLDNLVTKEELNSKGYVTDEVLNSKGYLTEHQNISHLVTNDELNSKGYLTEEVLNSKNYLTEDVLNTKNYLTQHQDLSSLVTKQELENKHYLTEHQPLTHLATTSDLEVLRNIAVSKSELNNKLDTTEFNTFKDNVVTKTELAEKGYISDLSNYVTKEELHEATEIDYSNIVTTDELEPYAKKSELPQPYNDTALVSRVSALESKQDKDTVYNDTEVKQRLTALENRPNTGGGVQTKDTGWITISEENPLNGNIVRIRRVNDMVYVSLNNPDTDNAHLQLELTDGHGAVLAEKEIQKGFTPMRTVIVPVISNIETIMLSTDLNTTGQAVFNVVNNRVTLKAYDKDITSGIPTSKHINDFSYFTEDPFPTNLH